MKSVKREHTNQEDDMPQRKRQIAHVEGNWPSFAYILLPTEKNSESVYEFLDTVNSQFNLSEKDKFISLTEEKQGFKKWHVSLTKLFFLRNFQIAPFVKAVRESIKCNAFPMTLSEPKVFTNEDKSRSLCSLLVQKGFNSVIRLIHQLDTVLTRFKKDIYYSPPVPHCTLGSHVGDLSEQAKQLNMYGNEFVEEDDYDDSDDECIELDVNEIYLSIGNQTYTIPLHFIVYY